MLRRLGAVEGHGVGARNGATASDDALHDDDPLVQLQRHAYVAHRLYIAATETEMKPTTTTPPARRVGGGDDDDNVAAHDEQGDAGANGGAIAAAPRSQLAFGPVIHETTSTEIMEETRRDAKTGSLHIQKDSRSTRRQAAAAATLAGDGCAVQ